MWSGILPAPPSAIRVRVDIDKEGRIKCVIHELLHVVFREWLWGKVDAFLEEEVILAWEKALNDYVRQSPRRLASWRKAIDKKLAEQVAPEDD
jgi:hypothetical protein